MKDTSGFPRLAWSNLAAQSAEQIGLAATPLVAVLALGAGAGETGFLQTAQTLPFLLLAIPAGLLADRMPRQCLTAASLLALRLARRLAAQWVLIDVVVIGIGLSFCLPCLLGHLEQGQLLFR